MRVPTKPLELSSEERSLPHPDPGHYRKYGITFVDLQPGDLELVRQWRNHPDIRRFMVFQDEITPEMQERWYRSLDPHRMVFSVVVFRGEKIGLTHLKNIDSQRLSGEGGIAIWRPEHQNGLLSYRIAIAGLDYNFLQRGLKSVEVTVLSSNSRARRFVRSLGYSLSPVGDGEIQKGYLDPSVYFPTVRPWRELIRQEMVASGEPFPAGS